MIKKLAKIFMWFAIIFFVVVIIAIIIVRLAYPPEKIKKLAISELESAINRKAGVGTVWFNPLKGFTLNNVKIYQQSPQDSVVRDTTVFFQAKRIHSKYRFWALLKREIEINTISIDQPEINLVQDENLRWNFDDLIEPDSTSIQTTAEDSTEAEISLPLSLKLKNLSLNNFTATIFIHQMDTIITLKTSGISLHVNELVLPRKSLEELKQNTRANLKIFSEQKPWEFSLETRFPPEKIMVSSVMQLNVDFNLAGLQQIEGNGKLALADVVVKRNRNGDSLGHEYKVPVPELTSVSFDLTTDADKGNLSLNKLLVLVGKETLFDIQGNIHDYLNQPLVDLEVRDSKMSLSNLIDLFKPFLPDTFQTQFDNFSLQGNASFAGSKIQGNPLGEKNDDALSFNLNFSIDNLSARYFDPEINLTNELINLKLESKAEGLYNINGIQETDVSANLKLDSIYVAVDTMQFIFEDMSLDFVTLLNSEFMPDSLSTRLRVEQFFNVPLDFNFRFISIDRLSKYEAAGGLVVKELPLANIPESTMEGVVDFDLNLNSESLDRIQLDIKAASDIIEVQTETQSDPLILYPMDFWGDALLSTDTTFQKIKLDQLIAQISDFASGRIHGDFVFDNQPTLNLIIDNFTVEHDKVMEILPAQFIEGFESLQVGGSTNLTSKLSVIFPENEDLNIQADGSVTFNASVKYPDKFFTLGAIDGKLDFNMAGEAGNFNAQARLDSLVIEGVQDEPLRNMSVSLKGEFPDFETLKLDSIVMIIPDFMTNAFVTTRIDSLSSDNIRLKGSGFLSLNTEGDTVTSLNMLKLSGELLQKLEFSLADNIADITGQLVIHNLNVMYEDLAQIDSISGKIYLSQKFDIENEKIIENPLNQSFIAGAGSYYYDLLRPYYQQDQDRFSYLQIARIKAMDYVATNINFDFFIHNERIEIPRFSLLAYDGNMSGLMYANLHEGKLDQVEWKVKANISRLNSAKLIPTRRIKSRGSDLNMNLELSGMGIDPASQLDIEGYFYVTKIGPQFTDNVLRSLDPRGTDKSIQDTRRLLNWGYKPRLISFEIKHGNLYPTMHLVKGKLLTKLIPLNLSGGKIELARIPVKFFFQNMMTERE